MKTRILAMALISGLVFALPLMVQAAVEEHGSGHGEEHGGGHDEEHGGGHGEEHGGGHEAEYGGYGGGHGKHVDVSGTQSTIGTIALLFIIIILTNVFVQAHIENKKHPGGHH